MDVTKDTYRTIAAPSKGIFKDKGSRFIGLTYPVVSDDQIKEILASIKKEYYDATHHCYAYRLGEDKDVFRANDDGEPSGSAGKPILGQILSHDLTNILIVVVRYYGGVKLGVSGLINAYRAAASEALIAGEIVEKIVEVNVLIRFGYLAMNSVMKVIKDENLKQLRHNFDVDCEILVVVRKGALNKVVESFNKIENTKTEILK